MTGYTNTDPAGSQAPPVGTTNVQSDKAAQGGYLGKAQGWTNRVTTNLQGQAEHLKGKVTGSQGTAGTTGQSVTGTRTGYEPTGTGSGYSSTGTTGYSDPNTGYTAGNQPGVAHGHNAHLSQGYAPAQATTGGAVDGTYGSTAQKPSYTDQAKSWTARAADNLHGQAEYLKGKLVGTEGTAAGGTAGTGTGTYSQGTYVNQGPGTGTNTGAEHHQGAHLGQGQGTGDGAGYGQQGGQYTRAGESGVNTATGAPQAKKSWTDTAKQYTATGLTYTQQGLEAVKNKVAGPTGTTGTGTTGSSYSTGQPSTGTNTKY